MFTVECPGCKASYQVDERRVPAAGLKMRCPKCATAFVVDKPSGEENLPAMPGASADGGASREPWKAPLAPKPPRPAPLAPKPTLRDRPSGLGATERRGASRPAGARSDEGQTSQDDEIGLPAIGNKPIAGVAAPLPPRVQTNAQAVENRQKPPLPRRTMPSGDDELLPDAQAVENRQKPPLPRRTMPSGDDELLPAAAKQDPHPPATKGPRKPPLTAPRPGSADRGAAIPQKGRDIESVALELPEEPALPAVIESELPAALFPRDASASHPNFAKAPPALSDLDFEDLPVFAEPGDVDLPSPKKPLASTVLDQSRDIESQPPLSLAPASGSVRPASNPPQLDDDFEFELPSPLQAQMGLAGADEQQDVGTRSRGTIPGGFELPDLDIDLPVKSQQNVGLPSVPGRFDGSKKTLAGTGTSSLQSTLDSVAPPSGRGVTREVDLGLDFELVSDRPQPSPAARKGDTSQSAALSASDAGFGSPLLPDLDLPPGGLSMPSPRSSMGELELPIKGAPIPQRNSGIPSSPPANSNRQSLAAHTVGGTAYGEVSFDAAEQDIQVDTESNAALRGQSGEYAEFDAAPHGAEAPKAGSEAEVEASRELKAPHGERKAEPPPPIPGRNKKTGIIVSALLAAVVVGGSALTLLPDIGPFGAHFLVDQIQRKENEALVLRHVNEARRVLKADDFSGVESVLSGLEAERRKHARLRELQAFAAYYAYAIELRHGSQPESSARAKVILTELSNRPMLKYLALAGAARAAAEGNLAKARRNIQDELAREPHNLEALAVSAEVSMLERRPADALASWQSAARLEPSARAIFGQARAQFALGQFEAATASATEALKLNPTHVGAKLLLARMALGRGFDIELAQKLIHEALQNQPQQSHADFVLAKTIMGDLHLMGSRISFAEAAYREALAKDPRSSAALRGLGETLYRAGRYSESLARCEAGLQADPDDVLVAVGVAKAQLALERIQDAVALLIRLRQANPKHQAVNFWYGKAQEAAGNRDEAEKAYAVAIEVGGKEPEVVDAYVAMALLKNQQGRREEAQKLLAVAQEKLPRLPKIHDAIGQLALSEGRHVSAIEQFRLALTLDPNDLGIKFRLGIALRKNRDFDAAAKVFNDVEAVDRDYPGLALERGQLYEASGQTDEALRAFESALAKAPNDPDLMLRVGCGKVTAGRLQQSEQLLKKVLEQRPTSAETHHCLGRAQLLDGSNLALALRTLERAVELDPHRAEFHLYVGWAANEAGRIAVAEQALKKALELDQGLGDAYWQRGILRYRQGAVKDAVADLTRALELRPGRYEAHAALADAYFDLGLEQKALEQWHLTTVAQPDNATWRFRYGKLLQAARRDAEARPELQASLELAAKLPVMPRWAWEAHHLLARAIGQHPTAIKHWQAFLELAPRDNVYRDEAKQALLKLGQPWDKD